MCCVTSYDACTYLIYYIGHRPSFSLQLKSTPTQVLELYITANCARIMRHTASLFTLHQKFNDQRYPSASGVTLWPFSACLPFQTSPRFLEVAFRIGTKIITTKYTYAYAYVRMYSIYAFSKNDLSRLKGRFK